MNPDPMDIVRNYLSVLEKRKDYGMAMPLSLLSHTKTEIKEAIKAVIPKARDAEERERLKKGYITLSEFIPDNVLHRVNQDWQDVADAECETGTDTEPASEADIMSEVAKVQKNIADEGASLFREISEFINKI